MPALMLLLLLLLLLLPLPLLLLLLPLLLLLLLLPLLLPPLLLLVATQYEASQYQRIVCLASRYEGRIVQQMIRNDGGKGDYTEVTPPMLGIWETVLAVGSCPLLICCILSPVVQIHNCHKGCKTTISLQSSLGSCKVTPGHAN